MIMRIKEEVGGYLFKVKMVAQPQVRPQPRPVQAKTVSAKSVFSAPQPQKTG